MAAVRFIMEIGQFGCRGFENMKSKGLARFNMFMIKKAVRQLDLQELRKFDRIFISCLITLMEILLNIPL